VRISEAVAREAVQRGVESALVMTGLGTARWAAMGLQVLLCPDLTECPAKAGVHKEVEDLMQTDLAEELRNRLLGQ
jgi:hypothetical protein